MGASWLFAMQDESGQYDHADPWVWERVPLSIPDEATGCSAREMSIDRVRTALRRRFGADHPEDTIGALADRIVDEGWLTSLRAENGSEVAFVPFGGDGGRVVLGREKFFATWTCRTTSRRSF